MLTTEGNWNKIESRIAVVSVAHSSASTTKARKCYIDFSKNGRTDITNVDD